MEWHNRKWEFFYYERRNRFDLVLGWRRYMRQWTQTIANRVRKWFGRRLLNKLKLQGRIRLFGQLHNWHKKCCQRKGKLQRRTELFKKSENILFCDNCKVAWYVCIQHQVWKHIFNMNDLGQKLPSVLSHQGVVGWLLSISFTQRVSVFCVPLLVII